MSSLDEVIRTRLWKDEGKVVTCDRHIVGFSNIEKVSDIKKKIQCGQKNCTKDAQYEIKLQF